MFRNLLFLVLLFPILAYSQTGSIKGRLISSANGQGVAFVSVGAVPNFGTTSNENGNFILDGLPYGEYQIQFTCIGYEPYSTETIKLNSISPVVDLGNITFNISSIMIEEITITEQQKVYDSRYAGTNNVISLKKIKELQPISSEEMIRTIPGVNIAGDMGLGNRPNISIRGSDPRRSNKILLMEDGAPISPAPYLAPGAYYNVPADRLEGIQVIKGPETLVYGANNIFGVVNYITKRPPADPTFTASLTGGQRNYFAGVANYGGTWKNTGAEFMAMYKSFDGFTDNADMNIVNFSGKWFSELNKNQSIYLKIVFQTEKVQNSLSGITPFTFEHDPTENPFDAEIFTSHRYGIDLIHNWKINDKTNLQSKIYGSDFYRDWWKQNTTVIKAEDVQSYVGDEVFHDKYSYMEGLSFGAEDYVRVGKITNGYESNSNSRWAYQVVGLQEKLKHDWGKHKFETAAKLHYENYHDITITNDSSRWARSGTTTGDMFYHLIAPSAYVKNDFNFGNVQITPIARFELLYLTKNDLLKNANNPANNSEKFGDIKNNFHELTPGLNVIYRNLRFAKMDVEFYGSIYKGYSSPTTAIAFVTVENGEVVPTTSDETNMKPETSLNTEIGSRFENIHQIFNGQIAVFNMDISNFYSPARAQAFEALGSVRISGLEFAWNMDITKAFSVANHKLSFGTALTFMTSEITSGSLTDNDMFNTVIHTAATENEIIAKINATPEAYAVFVDGILYTGEVTSAMFDDITKVIITYGDGKAEGYDVPYVPKMIANVNLNYKFKQFSADVSMNYTGEQYTEFFSLENESADGSVGKLPAYYFVNANLNYTLEKENTFFSKTTIFISGKNITDQIYRSSRLNRATGGLFPYGFRQINAGISMNF